MQVGIGFRELVRWWKCWSPAVRGRFVGIAVFAAMVLAIQMPYAASLRAMALGEPPIQAIVRIDGQLILNHETTGQVEIWNRSSQAARIVGMNRSCRCLVLNDNPFSQIIPANEHISLPLVIKSEKTGQLHQRIVLFIDHAEQFRVNVDIVGFSKGEKR